MDEATEQQGGSVTVKATVTTGVMIRNDGPTRNPIACGCAAIETINDKGQAVALFSRWPSGEARVVQSDLVERVMQQYHSDARPMTIAQE